MFPGDNSGLQRTETRKVMERDMYYEMVEVEKKVMIGANEQEVVKAMLENINITHQTLFDDEKTAEGSITGWFNALAERATTASYTYQHSGLEASWTTKWRGKATSDR